MVARRGDAMLIGGRKRGGNDGRTYVPDLFHFFSSVFASSPSALGVADSLDSLFFFSYTYMSACDPACGQNVRTIWKRPKEAC